LQQSKKIILKNVVGGPLAAGMEIYWAACLQRLRTTAIDENNTLIIF